MSGDIRDRGAIRSSAPSRWPSRWCPSASHTCRSVRSSVAGANRRASAGRCHRQLSLAPSVVPRLCRLHAHPGVRARVGQARGDSAGPAHGDHVCRGPSVPMSPALDLGCDAGAGLAGLSRPSGEAAGGARAQRTCPRGWRPDQLSRRSVSQGGGWVSMPMVSAAGLTDDQGMPTMGPAGLLLFARPSGLRAPAAPPPRRRRTRRRPKLSRNRPAVARAGLRGPRVEVDRQHA